MVDISPELFDQKSPHFRFINVLIHCHSQGGALELLARHELQLKGGIHLGSKLFHEVTDHVSVSGFNGSS